MIGTLLILCGGFFEEVSYTLGKSKILKRQENLYTFGFLQMVWALVIMLAILFWRNSFVFMLASLPTLSIRIILELAQTYSSLHALKDASRSTLGFLMTLTIPILLGIDLFMGYNITPFQVWAIILLTFTLLLLSFEGALDRKGIYYVLFSSINAAITMTLFKYDVTHFNSPEVEQTIVFSFMILFLFFLAKREGENPIAFIFKKGFFVQSASHGVSMTLNTFALSLLAPSVFAALKRVFITLSSIISGYFYFHEKHIVIKVISFSCIVVSIILFSL